MLPDSLSERTPSRSSMLLEQAYARGTINYSRGLPALHARPALAKKDAAFLLAPRRSRSSVELRNRSLLEVGISAGELHASKQLSNRTWLGPGWVSAIDTDDPTSRVDSIHKSRFG